MYSYRKYVKSIEYAWAESHLNKAEGILKKIWRHNGMNFDIPIRTKFTPAA